MVIFCDKLQIFVIFYQVFFPHSSDGGVHSYGRHKTSALSEHWHESHWSEHLERPLGRQSHPTGDVGQRCEQARLQAV